MKKNLVFLLGMVVLLVQTLSSTAQAPVTNLDESKVPPYTLPDALLMANGKRVTTVKQWETVQRPYWFGLYEENQFGRYPKQKINIHFRVREEDKNALNGLATRKQVRIYLHPADTSVYLDLLMYLPNKVKGKVPVFVGYNFSGNHTVSSDPHIFLSEKWIYGKAKGVVNNQATDSSRGADSSQWPVREIINHGFAVATAYYGDLETDNPDGWKTGIRATLKDVLKIEPEEWSAMGAWAWGLSRIYDYLQKDAGINASKVAVIGHSRLGKAALWAGASDPRFALVVSNESGEGGASLSKRWYGETVQIINKNFPYWFNEKYKTYAGNTGALPIDGNILLSLIAPRPLYVASAVGDQWSDPKGEFLSAKDAGEVYALYGKKGIEADSLPPLEHPVGGWVHYHIRSGRHDVTLYDWQQYLNFAGNYLNKN